VCRVFGYTQQSQAILRFSDEPERKLVAFPDAAVLNVDGAWPTLSMERPRLDIQVLVLKGLCGRVVGRVMVFVTRRSTLTIRL
jgi:hypothetical protein